MNKFAWSLPTQNILKYEKNKRINRLNLNNIRSLQIAIISVHYGSVRVKCAVLSEDSVLGVDVAEKVSFKIEIREFGEEFFGAVIDVVVEIQNAVCRGVCYQDVCVGWNIIIECFLAVGNTIFHKHRHSIEFDSVNLYSRIAKVVNVGVETINVGSVETRIMVAADEDFIFVR